MLTSKEMSNPESGQAMIEFLPAIILFIVVIAASLVFFIGMRESYQMQEAARNAAFAKMANSGTLVSPKGRSEVKGQYEFPMYNGLKNVDVTPNDTCFTAQPRSGQTSAKLPSIMGLDLNLDRAHKASVFRLPGSPNLCDNIN